MVDNRFGFKGEMCSRIRSGIEADIYATDVAAR